MASDSNGEDRRSDFVKEMYRVYWANMARSMEGVWKILSPITVAGTIIAGVHKDYLPAPMGISLALLVIIWALNVTIDLNAWHRRNLFFAAKAEQEFLSEQDYGRLLPGRYRKPDKGWITFYQINVIAFLTFLFLSVLYASVWKLRDAGFVDGQLLPLAILVLGLLLSGINAWAKEKSARTHFKELFGMEGTSATIADDVENKAG